MSLRIRHVPLIPWNPINPLQNDSFTCSSSAVSLFYEKQPKLNYRTVAALLLLSSPVSYLYSHILSILLVSRYLPSKLLFAGRYHPILQNISKLYRHPLSPLKVVEPSLKSLQLAVLQYLQRSLSTLFARYPENNHSKKGSLSFLFCIQNPATIYSPGPLPAKYH